LGGAVWLKKKIETIIHREEVLGDVMVIEGICNNKKKFVFKKGQQLFLINSMMKEFLNV
jgi:hypothetical protein